SEDSNLSRYCPSLTSSAADCHDDPVVWLGGVYCPILSYGGTLSRSEMLRFRICVFLSLSVSCLAQRQPVLKQIDLPHFYYFREMYLPQLTTGLSAVAWSPDSRTLIYSMAGSLWRQNVGTTTAEQLTSGAGYDYQPDCSPDGRWVVFARYEN